MKNQDYRTQQKPTNPSIKAANANDFDEIMDNEFKGVIIIISKK